MRRREGALRDPAHEGFRKVCRILGPLMILGGFVMVVVGVYSFSTRFDEPLGFPVPFGKQETRKPDLFWLCFVGMMVLIGGIWLTSIGYMGAAARYVAAETAPVATDAFNYVARGASEGVKQIAGAVADGIRGEAGGKVVVRCHKCEAGNDADARFCKACGAALGKSVTCPACNERNDPDANFCDNCGGKLS
ncbi:MAG TPA: zinc ribbon domain-containing protein [Planctomycetota bacterium]|nr:zinc ribbon domain-containing protein [Planctomycetota bacterium]